MKLISKGGKHFLIGKSAEVGRVLLKKSANIQSTDVGWTLNQMANDASYSDGKKYNCDDCGFIGCDPDFPDGGCPQCRSKKISQA
jgi:rubrerythrin